MIAPQVVVTVPARIHIVRAQGGAVAWMQGRCHTVKVLLKGRVVTLGDLAGDVECNPERQPLLAIAANGTGLWVGAYSGNDTYADVFGHTYFAQVVGGSSLPSGDYVGGVAAAAGRLYYSVLRESSSDGCVVGGTCTMWVASGAVEEVVGRGARKVPGLPPAVDLAGGDDRLAVVVAAHDIPRVDAVPSGEIDVYSVPGFRKVATVDVPGKILAVAVSHSALAVLTPGSIVVGSTTIPVPPDVVRISLSGRHVAYASGRKVYVDGRVVARRAVTPIGVSIAPGRVVWAERRPGVSRIYALRVP